jgi:hypothetical protein
MRKQLTMTTAMAAALVALPACSSNNGWNEDVIADRDTAVCVNQQGERVDDDLCDDDRGRGVGSSAFLWYYIGRSAAVPYYGDSIYDRRFTRHGRSGTFAPQPGVNYARAPAKTKMTRSQAVSRGGLGSSSRRFGGGRS